MNKVKRKFLNIIDWIMDHPAFLISWIFFIFLVVVAIIARSIDNEVLNAYFSRTLSEVKFYELIIAFIVSILLFSPSRKK